MSTQNPSNTGLFRALKACKFSYQGFLFAWKHESAFRQECILLLIALPLAAWLADSALIFAALIAPLLLVILAEFINSSIEAIVDHFDQQNPLFGAAKDMGSAAVFVALLIAALVWLCVLWHRFA